MYARHLILPLVLLLGACGGRYLGLDQTSLDPSTQSLVVRSQTGDKRAQYELGLRFAAGDGVPQDCGKARKLMRQAASKSGGTLWVYSPPVTKEGSGRVIPIDSGSERAGLPKAKDALENVRDYAGL